MNDRDIELRQRAASMAVSGARLIALLRERQLEIERAQRRRRRRMLLALGIALALFLAVPFLGAA